MKFLLFGTGDYYNRYRKWFEEQEVLALLDNAERKQHTVMDGWEVLSPEEGIKLEYDAIVILSFYVKQMKNQLLSLGVEGSRIYHFYDLNRLLFGRKPVMPVQYYLNAKEVMEKTEPVPGKVLLLSQDLTMGGPGIALFHAAEVLAGKGFGVVYGSMLDGPMREKLMEKNIPVVVDENLQISTMRETRWVEAFSLIVCNTMNFHVFLSERDAAIPVIWWLHDAGFFYDGVDRNVIGKIRLDNLKAVTVGPVPAKAVKEFLPAMECGELLYGVEDVADGGCIKKNIEGKLRFTTIGFFEDIKGQDILLEAIKRLSADVRCNCEFYMVGYNGTLFGEWLRKRSEGMKEVIYTGVMERKEIHELLENSDVLICPSRQDSMPTVAAEAMMHGTPCIMSDATGTAAYIQDGKDGLLFQNGDILGLAGKIEWCVLNKDLLLYMGKKARGLYENYFSMTAFADRFLEIVDHALEDSLQRGENQWAHMKDS